VKIAILGIPTKT